MNLKNCYRITMAAIAITGATVLSSCSHDDYYYNEEKAEQSVNDKYAAAFEKAFGKVGPNVDWGFSSKNANARAFTRAGGTYASSRGSIQPSISFPDDCAASEFDPDLTNVPSYEEYLISKGTQYWHPEEINDGGVVYIDAVQPIKISGGTEEQHAKLYIKKGTYDFTGVSFDLNINTDLYLLEGATVTFDNNVAASAKFDIYIAEGAELIANGEDGLVADAGHIYNHGTITCTDFTATSTGGFLYNVGTLTTTGTVNASSITSRIVNDGTINSAEVIVDAGGVQNNYEWTVTGTTKINSPNSGWVNNGHWTTYDYAYVGGSVNVINNCFLKVDNNFEMNISSDSTDGEKAFKMDSGCGVLTTNFYGGRDSSTGAISGPFKIIMGQNSVFKVEETAILESGRSSFPNLDKYEFGFFGPDEGYAVFQAKNIVREESIKNTWGAVTYGGNLYVSAEKHFAQGNDGLSTHPFIITQDGFDINVNIYAEGFKPGKPSITIEETPCCPGFYGGDPTYRVIAEDLNAQGNTDFDFNDVVFDVEPNEAGTAAKITVLAAGGIYRLEVDGVEVHKALLGGDGQINENGFYPMINTGDGPQVDPVVIRTAYSGNFSSDENIRATILGITVKVWKPLSNNSKDVVECTLSANRGEPASKVLVDKNFGIVPEHHSIADSYGNFTNYVQGSFEDDFWWK